MSPSLNYYRKFVLWSNGAVENFLDPWTTPVARAMAVSVIRCRIMVIQIHRQGVRNIVHQEPGYRLAKSTNCTACMLPRKCTQRTSSMPVNIISFVFLIRWQVYSFGFVFGLHAATVTFKLANFSFLLLF